VAPVLFAAAQQRHHRDAGLEPAHAEGELGEDEQAEQSERRRVPAHDQRLPPAGEDLRVGGNLEEGAAERHQVEQQVGHAKGRRHPDRLPEAHQEDDRQRDQQGDQQALVAGPGVQQRVLDRVLGGVRGREGDGDDEVGGGEAQQDQHQDLGGPAGEQVLEHRHRALPRVGAGGHLAVDGQRPQQRHRHQDHGGERRQRSRGEEGDARLVAEGSFCRCGRSGTSSAAAGAPLGEVAC